MTRFARAKGSKSSNERHPEEATPWHEMKQQMQKKRTNEKKPSAVTDAKKYIFTESKAANSIWTEFDNGKIEKKIPSEITHSNVLGGSSVHNNLEGDYAKKKDKLHQIKSESSKIGKKLSKRKRKIKDMIESSTLVKENAEYQEAIEQENSKQSEIKGMKKRFKSQTDDGKSITNNEVTLPNNKNEMIFREKKQKVKNKSLFEKSKFKGAKKKHGKDYKPGKSGDSSSMTMFINGKEIEVVKYDGFPVKKEDAVRLTELRKQLKARGIPHESIVATMKLERRRAEKALARERKKVCFRCRKSGHVLSDCPELTEVAENGTGICFKCGSTEHAHFQCKVSRGDDYRHALCFICKEQGHIARQCPDNPRGLYPKGGACKVCGAVTHLKKDCPDLIKEKEQQIITLKPLNDSSLEALDDRNATKPSKVIKKLKKKTVTF